MLASYLNEFVFRFNRRRSRSRGMVFYRVLELAVAHDPVRYQDLIATRRPRAVRPTPPQVRGHPPSLDADPLSAGGTRWSGSTAAKSAAEKDVPALLMTNAGGSLTACYCAPYHSRRRTSVFPPPASTSALNFSTSLPR